MSYRIATDNEPDNPNPHAFDLGAKTFETEEEAWYVIDREEKAEREEHGEPWGSSIVLSESLYVTEAVLNIRQAIQVIAPIWQSMSEFGHSQADDVAGAQADLEQAIRFLTGQEVPS